MFKFFITLVELHSYGPSMAHSFDIQSRSAESSANSSHSYHSYYERKHVEDRMSIDEKSSYRRGRYIYYFTCSICVHLKLQIAENDTF